MKKLGIMGCIVTLFFLAGSAFAAEGTRMYVGVGGTLAVEYFNADQFEGAAPYGFDPSYDNTWGINGKFGYKINPIVSVEMDLQYLFGFNASQTLSSGHRQYNYDGDLDVFTAMAVAKIFPPLQGIVRPYFAAGLGLMHASWEETISSPGLMTNSPSSDEMGACAKLGIGVDIYLTPTLSLNVEGAYTAGFGSDIDTIRYFGLSAGLGFHF